MYGSSKPLFDAGAIAEVEDSDDDGGDFLQNLKNP
jgi:hypothetical protein